MSNRDNLIKQHTMLEKIKMLLYLVGAYIGIEVEAFMILVSFMCMDSVLGAIKALIGNIYAAKNKVEVDKLDAVSLLLVYVRMSIKKVLDTLLDKASKL